MERSCRNSIADLLNREDESGSYVSEHRNYPATTAPEVNEISIGE